MYGTFAVVLVVNATNLENLEASNIEDTDVVLTLGFRVQGLIDSLHQPREGFRVQTLRQRLHAEAHLRQVLTLGDVITADLDLGCEQRLQEILRVDTQQVGDLLRL